MKIHPWNPWFLSKIDPWEPWKSMENASGGQHSTRDVINQKTIWYTSKVKKSEFKQKKFLFFILDNTSHKF